ncbi:MAG: LCP family protein [Chloroflexota bacterium]
MKRWLAGFVLVIVIALSLFSARYWYVQAIVEQGQGGMTALLQNDATETPAASEPTVTMNVSPTPSATPRILPTLLPSSTPQSTVSPTPSATPSPTPTFTPSATLTPSQTPTASVTPFATLEPEELAEDAVIPTPVTPFERPDGITNILLLGNDVGARQGGRTDSMLIDSIDEVNQTASMLSLPRDLYVVIPGWKMTRINLALPHGHGSDYPGGGGALVKDTILYNLGLPVDYYVRIGFDGFRDVVDLMHGVDVAVSCEIEDWKLKDPELDPNEEENWEMFSLGPDIHHMHGDTALWYVRSRRNSSDFERGRRQQQVLRAILDKGLELEMIAQLPALWETYRETVETDLPLPVMLRLAALAPAVRENGIQHLFLPEAARRAWRAPGGAAVQLLQWEGAEPVLGQLMRPPVLNRAAREAIPVEVVTAHDAQYTLAADNLAYHGFVPSRVESSEPAPGHTHVTYFGDNFKGSYDWLLSWIVGVPRDEINLSAEQSVANGGYRVVLGEDYDPCRPQLEAPSLGWSD